MCHTKKVTINGTLGDGDVAHQKGYNNWNTWGWGMCHTKKVTITETLGDVDVAHQGYNNWNTWGWGCTPRRLQ